MWYHWLDRQSPSNPSSSCAPREVRGASPFPYSHLSLRPPQVCVLSHRPLPSVSVLFGVSSTTPAPSAPSTARPLSPGPRQTFADFLVLDYGPYRTSEVRFRVSRARVDCKGGDSTGAPGGPIRVTFAEGRWLSRAPDVVGASGRQPLSL